MGTQASFGEFAARLHGFIDSSEKDGRQHKAIEFERLALDLFVLQFENNPAYRRICEARGTHPSKVSHWSDIPAVPASAFKELQLTCLPPAERTRVFCSSGTTGQRPSRHFHNAESFAPYEASLRCRFLAGALVAARFGKSSLAFLPTPPLP